MTSLVYLWTSWIKTVVPNKEINRIPYLTMQLSTELFIMFLLPLFDWAEMKCMYTEVIE